MVDAVRKVECDCVVEMCLCQITLDTCYENSSPKRSGINIITVIICRFICAMCIAVGYNVYAFSALMLLVGWQEGHPACKKLTDGVLV